MMIRIIKTRLVRTLHDYIRKAGDIDQRATSGTVTPVIPDTIPDMWYRYLYRHDCFIPVQKLRYDSS